MTLEPVQSLWVGPISPLEQLCMRSFLKAGHPYHLYVYDSVEGVPEGVSVKDANEIVPHKELARFQNLANFSDYFRYSLLYRNGHWWADLDVCCLRPFTFADPYVLATQLVVQRTNDEVTSCVIKAPQWSEFMDWCIQRVNATDTKHNKWSAIGPALLLEGHKRFGLQASVKPHETFCPLHYFEAPENVMDRAPTRPRLEKRRMPCICGMKSLVVPTRISSRSIRGACTNDFSGRRGDDSHRGV